MPVKLGTGWFRRLSWQTVVAALISGGIIHLTSTLVVPRVATTSAYQRLTHSLPVNRMQVLPRASRDSQIIPFLEADVRLAICRYDVSDGPINLNAILPEKGWSLAFYSSQGDNFFVLPAQDMRRSQLSLTLLPPPERLFGLFHWGRSASTSATEIQVPTPQGMIVLRAPYISRAHGSDIESTLQKAQCGQTPRTS